MSQLAVVSFARLYDCNVFMTWMDEPISYLKMSLNHDISNIFPSDS